MTAPESIRDAYARVTPIVEEVARYVRATLEPYSRTHTYIFLDRRKSLASLSEKLEGGRISAWSELDDLYACTVVVPVAAHEEAVVRKLDASFERKILRSRSQAKMAPDVFRFDGVRWYGVLRPDAAAQRQPGVGDQIFEVQVVTAFEYAWIAVTHDLVYKSDNVNWQRQRLAAQLKAAVEQIEVLIAAFDSASSVVLESPWPENQVKAEIIERCQLLVDDQLVPDALHPLSWRRFADNFYSLVKSYQKDPARIGDSVSDLLNVMDADLRGADPFLLPLSGSLLQYVFSIVARPQTQGNLSKFTVVPSRELIDSYRLSDLTKPFVFDGASRVTTDPEAPVSVIEDVVQASAAGDTAGEATLG